MNESLLKIDSFLKKGKVTPYSDFINFLLLKWFFKNVSNVNKTNKQIAYYKGICCKYSGKLNCIHKNKPLTTVHETSIMYMYICS